MIFYDVVQGEPEWYEVRKGVATASCFSKIITPTGRPSEQADAYANLLIAEMIKDQPLEMMAPTYWMEKGTINEVKAGELYEMMVGEQTSRAGFITDDTGLIGCSPDRLVGADGLLEIKCPAPQTHVKNMLQNKIASEYIPQVQGQLYVACREWSDWFSYEQDMPPVKIRTYRDEAFILKLEAELNTFIERIHEKFDRLEQLHGIKKPETFVKKLKEKEDNFTGALHP